MSVSYQFHLYPGGTRRERPDGHLRHDGWDRRISSARSLHDGWRKLHRVPLAISGHSDPLMMSMHHGQEDLIGPFTMGRGRRRPSNRPQEKSRRIFQGVISSPSGRLLDEANAASGQPHRKRSTDGLPAVVASGASVAYTVVYVADDLLRFRRGKPRPCGLPVRWRVASGKAAGRQGRPGWSSPAGVRASRSARPRGRGRLAHSAWV